MATIDLSRSSTNFRKHYSSVRAQMGRVFTDDDHNENERIHSEDERLSRVHIIGPAGSPDEGFKIQNPRVGANGKINFDILPGTFYLGGSRLPLEPTEYFQTQSDWLNMPATEMPAPPANASRFDLVYLECWQQAVSAVEDSEVFEVALGGPDTSVRMRQMRRVHVASGTATGDCHVDWEAVVASWSAAGLGTLNEQDELVVDTQLMVGFVPGTNPSDLCTPPVSGGYLGAENQAIRVQLVDASSFTWGFDNAAPLYRVTIGPNNQNQLRKVTMLTEPKDQAHWPVAGQVAEILPWSAVLSNMEKTAEVSGFLARVDVSYDPDTGEFFLATDVPAGFGEDWLSRPDATTLQPEFFYLRVWNRGTDTTSPVAIPFVNGTPVALGNTGLNVTFTGNDHRPADYWIIAARPESPNRVVPWTLEVGRGPHGIRRYYAPLAVIQWTPSGNTVTGQVTHDCREKFPPLTRIRTCCTYTVGDGTHSFGAFDKIQAAIDALPDDGGEICILPGLYNENVIVVNRHDIRLHGCGSHTILQDSGTAQYPVITVQDSQRIALCELAIQAPAVVGIQLTSTAGAESNNAGLMAIDLDDLEIQSRDRSAIDCRGGQFLRIRRNDIQAQELTGPLTNQSNVGTESLVFVRADDVLLELNRLAATGSRRLVTAAGGLHLGGGCERIEVRRNKILGGNGNGITLGSVTFTSQAGGAPGPASASGYTAVANFGFVIDENGCLQPDPNPQTPNDPNGNPLVPVSDGDLLDIRILENDILDMGLNGIATLRFFQQDFGPIFVRELDVQENRILNCLQLELGSQPFVQGSVVGYGGITLVAVEKLTLRDNWIEGNGRSFIDPVCGVFITLGRGLVLEANVIADNGPFVETSQQPTAGPRGGILVQMARTPLGESQLASTGAREEGFPAARIAGNTVIAPLGRALTLTAVGLVSIEGNEFTSRGVDQDNNPFGVTVAILDLGVSYELGGFLSGYATLGTYQPAGGTVDVKLAASFMIGGKVLFNDNQVLLAPLVGTDQMVMSSILVLTADHALLDGNQSECRTGSTQVLVTNALAMGWSAHITHNRFDERLTALGVSAFTFAVLNCTANNLGTRCFLALGVPALTIREPNRSLVSLFSPERCRSFSAGVAKAIAATGMNA